jgi:hypothetical protein
MSQSATEPHQTPPPDPDFALLPADILMNLIVIVLAPMFLAAAGADIGFARMAVSETIRAYQPRNQADMIAVAQIVACGLAALGSLSLSMTGDISPSMVLRLRGNANALNRSAEQNRRARPETTSRPAELHQEPADAAYEAEVLTSLADSEKRFAAVQAAPPAAEPAPPPAPVALLQAPEPAERRHQTVWARSMINVAKNVTASLPDLSPQERKTAVLQVEALSRCANDLLSGDLAPRPPPGALDAMLQPPAA